MMNNTLAEDYGIFKACAAEYDAAENEKAKEAARQKVQELYARIDARGEDYIRLYKLYESAQERGNEYIDLHDCIWDKDVQGLIDGEEDRLCTRNMRWKLFSMRRTFMWLQVLQMTTTPVHLYGAPDLQIRNFHFN